MLQIKFALGRCLSSMMSEKTMQLILAKVKKDEINASRPILKPIRDTEIVVTQDEKDVTLFVKLVVDAVDGISEYQIQKILKFSVRRYERARRNAMSFCMGALVWNNRSKFRKFYYHNNTIKVLQEKLI